MAGKFYGTPFASTGDRIVVPDAVQPDGSVSYSQGFGFDYERANTDPAYKPVPRDGMNGLFYDLTQAVGIVQKQGFADWTSAAAPYAINSAVRHNNQNWQSSTASNSDEPGVGAGATSWFPLGQQTQLIDTTRIDVASSATVDLNSLAPNTRNIRITGTTTITAFTVTVGRMYFVSFSGVLTLTNNASIVTNTGGNITTFAGMTIAVRATAANTVEVLYADRFASNTEAQTGAATDRAVTPANLNSTVLGMGQTWQNVTGSRAKSTTYTNTTGRPIFVIISGEPVVSQDTRLTIAGVEVSRMVGGSQSGTPSNAWGVVPAGATYSYTAPSGSALLLWAELR